MTYKKLSVILEGVLQEEGQSDFNTGWDAGWNCCLAKCVAILEEAGVDVRIEWEKIDEVD